MVDKNLSETIGAALVTFDKAKESITIADATTPEMPLIYVNNGFELFSGYERDEVLGQNCRFLQRHMRNQESVNIIREAIAGKKGCLVDLVNFRKDGVRFINRLSLQPIFNKAGTLKYFVGLQSNVTALKDLEEKIIQYIAGQSD